MIHALIDADILRYRVGFACQHTWYYVYVIGEEDQGPIASFGKKRDATGWVNGETDCFSIVPEVQIEPLEYCLHSVKQTVRSIYEALNTNKFTLYLSGENNFRKELNPEYKANRDPLHKPAYYNEITEYLIKHWDAQVVNRIEADDAMAIEQWRAWYDGYPEKTVICTIDKDLDQIPGWHYNFVQRRKYWITEFEGLRNFYTQLLVGDRADNIQGVYGLGEKTVAKLFQNVDTEIMLWDIVYTQYKKAYPDLLEDDLMKVIKLNADMLWILRYPQDEWKIPE
jgi:hypothetical protein